MVVLCVLFYSFLEIIVLFQYLTSDETDEKMRENPSEWETIMKFFAYVYPIMTICRLLNCSLNFYAYMFLQYRNKRAETHQRQKRQKDREMKMAGLNSAQNTNISTEETAFCPE